ncbi:NAD(P)/FAD-dependent oxidoreductase [Microvirga terricola]|uniref:FAD-binding oxidoreductase n=1 Tax=Microvirga terricola TaxID=2719797 RepID=A0ABX0VE03_9HYPH|nr:FAD-binding oxidoreductase [Microvirga terricola]NIX76561.1 FAD-binding oxidoreductase [Microvirga terricola]
MRKDVVVLGAGIVGVSIAIHLQKRGRSVLLVDRRGPGQETSYGNAGLIQREGVYPYGFPHDFGALLRYALNNTIDAHYHMAALPKLAPFLFQYWMHSRPAQHKAIARLYAPLIENSVTEHMALAEEAGSTALIRPTGWMKVFRSTKARDEQFRDAEQVKRDFGVNFEALDDKGVADREPHLKAELTGGLHWTDPSAIFDPFALTSSYVELFERLGGEMAEGDARTLEESGSSWRIQTVNGPVEAGSVVVALGPWADAVTKRLGYRFPLAVKRGYHMHYTPEGNAVLNRPTLDFERGYFLAPMAKGIRLTTGAEFANRDAPKTPVQLKRAEPIAKEFFPLGERVEEEPWMGMRPCTPDMMPIIGKAERHKNLWFSFGHAHHGMTLGPITGRLLAEMIVGEKPVIDPKPYRPDRF